MVNPNGFYTYAYLREDGTPYYIGKGKGKRINGTSGRRCKKPKDKSRIIFLKQNLTEEEAFKHEIYMISVFGVYSQDFYSYYQSYIDFPEEYRQQELTALFWFTLNMGWEFMQPDMIIDYQEEFNSFE